MDLHRENETQSGDDVKLPLVVEGDGSTTEADKVFQILGALSSWKGAILVAGFKNYRESCQGWAEPNDKARSKTAVQDQSAEKLNNYLNCINVEHIGYTGHCKPKTLPPIGRPYLEVHGSYKWGYKSLILGYNCNCSYPISNTTYNYP